MHEGSLPSQNELDANKHFCHLQCQMCGDQVCDKYLTFNDLPICEKDFRRVGHVCSVCDDLILDQVFNVEGVVMCEKDYNELISTWPCSACGKQIPQGEAFIIKYSRKMSENGNKTQFLIHAGISVMISPGEFQ